MSVVDWFKRVILGTDPGNGGLGGPDSFDGEDDDEKINVFGDTKQFYTEDGGYSYAENYVSTSNKESRNKAGTMKSQSRKMQSGSVTPVTGYSNLNISPITPKRFEGNGIHRTVQMLHDGGHTIILSLENCEEEQNFVSFAIGLAGGINGHINNVSQSIYILVLRDMGLSGNFEDVESQVAQMPYSKSV